MKIPTDGSIPILFAPLPKPRMVKFALAEFWNVRKPSEGTTDCRSFRSRISAFSMTLSSITETATGTSWSVCSRFVAVIVTVLRRFASSSPSSCAMAVRPLPATKAVKPTLKDSAAFKPKLDRVDFFISRLPTSCDYYVSGGPLFAEDSWRGVVETGRLTRSDLQKCQERDRKSFSRNSCNRRRLFDNA